MATIYWLSIYDAHWCHLANTTEPLMCGSDAALSQITLTTLLLLEFIVGVNYPFWTSLLSGGPTTVTRAENFVLFWASAT